MEKHIACETLGQVYVPLFGAQQVLDLLDKLKLSNEEKEVSLSVAQTLLTASQGPMLLRKRKIGAVMTESNDVPELTAKPCGGQSVPLQGNPLLKVGGLGIKTEEAGTLVGDVFPG